MSCSSSCGDARPNGGSYPHNLRSMTGVAFRFLNGQLVASRRARSYWYFVHVPASRLPQGSPANNDKLSVFPSTAHFHRPTPSGRTFPHASPLKNSISVPLTTTFPLPAPKSYV
jgi:hypothetical protein